MRILCAFLVSSVVVAEEVAAGHHKHGHKHQGHKHHHKQAKSEPSAALATIAAEARTAANETNDMSSKSMALVEQNKLQANGHHHIATKDTSVTSSNAELESLRLKVAQIKAGLDAKTVQRGVTNRQEKSASVQAVESQVSGAEDAAGYAVESPAEVDQAGDTPVRETGIDIDTAMPYGELEPFGREDTAQELTEDSVRESDEMVDQLERAEVAEEKRAVFRALTRLRGAAITSFDGIARSQTGNIDEYNKLHKWRRTHPLHHLADEESDISKWAFPDNADF